MVGSDEDRGRSRRLGVKDRGWLSTSQILCDQMIERSGGAMCSQHHAQGDEEREFLSLASKPRSMVSPSLASKPVAWFLWFGLKTTCSGFSDWASKLAVVVC
jgi:hypothetical protein